MLRTFAVALFAIVMSVGLAHATHAHKRMIAGCAEGSAGECEVRLRHGSRWRPNNLREGAMVPLLCTYLLEVRLQL
jgi:hypothetical protein